MRGFVFVAISLACFEPVAADDTPMTGGTEPTCLKVTQAVYDAITPEMRKRMEERASQGNPGGVYWEIVPLPSRNPEGEGWIGAIPDSAKIGPPVTNSDGELYAISFAERMAFAVVASASTIVLATVVLWWLLRRTPKINPVVGKEHKSDTNGEQEVSKPRVFLSYATENREVVNTYRNAIEHAGIDVWIDHQNIKHGESIVERLDVALTECQIAVLFFSEEYINSPWTSEEQRALVYMFIESNRNSEENRQLLVINLDDSPLPPLLAHRLWKANPTDCAQSIANLMGLGTENSATVSEKTVSGIPSELDAISLESFASQLVNQIAANAPTRTGLSVVLKRYGKLLVDCIPEAGDDDMLLDGIKHCLELCGIYRRHIGAHQKRLAKGGLGVFDEAFRIALDEQIELLDNARFGSNQNPGLREFLDGMILQVRTA